MASATDGDVVGALPAGVRDHAPLSRADRPAAGRRVLGFALLFFIGGGAAVMGGLLGGVMGGGEGSRRAGSWGSSSAS